MTNPVFRHFMKGLGLVIEIWKVGRETVVLVHSVEILSLSQ